MNAQRRSKLDVKLPKCITCIGRLIWSSLISAIACLPLQPESREGRRKIVITEKNPVSMFYKGFGIREETFKHQSRSICASITQGESIFDDRSSSMNPIKHKDATAQYVAPPVTLNKAIHDHFTA